MSQQSLRQASIRTVTGTTHDYQGDWHALFTNDGIAAGTYNERLLTWINTRLSASYTDINGAKAAFAAAEGASTFDAIGTFDASTTGYSTEAETYFAAMSVAPSTALKDLVDALITTLKADGVWTLIDWLGLGPLHDEQAARVNLKNPAQVATVSGSPTFTAKQGYAGDGASAYLDSGIAGSTLTPTDTSLFAWVRTNGSASRAVMGYASGFHQLTQGTTGKTLARLVTNSAASSSLTNSGSGQFICASRTGTTQTVQVNDTVEDTDTIVNATNFNTNTIKVFTEGTTFSNAQLSAWGFGKHLDNANAILLRSRLSTFITAAEAL